MDVLSWKEFVAGWAGGNWTYPNFKNLMIVLQSLLMINYSMEGDFMMVTRDG